MNFPQKFGKYLLVERIAVGGMAEIFKARTTGLGGFEKLLAIKRLHARHCEDGDLIKMLIDEAKIAVQLTHSNVVQVFDLDRLGDHYFICMEYIDGRDLHRIVRRRLDLGSPFPIDVACFIAREVSNGLDYAHRRMAQDGTPLGIIHRDVSPQNVLISWAGEVKIIDFGIAKAARRAYETEAGIIKGKFCYMSPEQARGGQVDHRSDIFSLGICLHEMLTGDLLYQDDGDDSLLTKVRRAQITPPGNIRRDIPPSLDRIVMKALARDPYDRYQSAAALGDALARFLHSAHPHTGRATVATFMGDTYDNAPPDAVPAATDDDTIMSRVDYQADGSSLIYDVVRGMPASGRGASGRTAAFDDDPFFNDAEEMYGKHDRKDPRSPSDDEVIEIHSEEISVLDEGDIEIVGGEVTPSGAYQPSPSAAGDYDRDYDPMDDEPTKVRRSPYLSEPSMPSASPTMDPNQPHPHHLEATFEEQPTQVYNKPQAILAATPGAEHGPLGGVARLDERATDASGAPLSEEPTVITAMDDIRPDRGRAEPAGLSGLPPVSAVREPTDPHGIAASAPVPAVGGVQLSPMLVISLFLLVLVLGGVLVLAIQLVVGGEEEPVESIAQPTPTEIPAPAEGETSPTAAAPETSAYYITSHPDGARVILDGRFVDSTPTTLSNLEIGRTYHLRLEKEGFEPHDQELTPAAGGTQSLALNLDPLLANLLVDTIPSGAAIYLDGVYREDSPTVIRGLDVRNTYVLSASMDGFLSQNQRIDWPEGTRSDRQVTLRLVPVEGSAGVADAVAMRTTSPEEERDEEPTERHTSSARHEEDDRDDSSRRERSSRERDRDEDEAREASRERTERRDRDDEEEERSSRSSRDDDEEEDDRRARRHRDREEEERASSSREERETSSSSEGGVGRISVQAVPAGQVFVDGELVATETPLMNHELEAGTHRVKVYFISLHSFSEERRVRVVEGEGRSVVFRSRD